MRLDPTSPAEHISSLDVFDHENRVIEILQKLKGSLKDVHLPRIEQEIASREDIKNNA